MTAQLPPPPYSFPTLSSSYHHEPSPPEATNSDHSSHDTTRAHTVKYESSQDTTPFSSTATPSSSCFSHSFTSPSLSNLEELPKLGSIRCYWTILSPSLDYVYLDPMLERHLGEFAQQFLGSNLLDFVHPDERDQLAEDLLPRPDRIAGVETAGVFGSVTRLRYSRLVGILRKLGCLDVPTLPDADKYALDADYLNLDLTTSWIAGNGITRGNHGNSGSAGGLGQGAVLAFFHVVGDKDQVKNNDLHNRGDWTNWCGVQVDEHRYFTPSRCEALVDVLESITSSSSRPSTSCNSEEDSKSALLASLHGLSSETTDGPPPHVFQVLDRNGKTIVSFPRPQAEDGKKRYEVESYAALAREVVARPRGAANAKTSCTKRYRSKHPVMKDSILTTIESVVIMYGSITFACFQTGGIYLTSARKAALGLSANQPTMSPTPGSAVSDFNLEDVPSTVPKPKSYLNYHKRATSMLSSNPTLDSPPPLKRIKTEPDSARPRLSLPPSNMSSAHGATSNGLSITTASARIYRPTIESEYGTNGGVSPTVASASAILGSISSQHTDPGASAHPHPSQDRRSREYPYSSSSHSFPHFRPHGASPASLYPPSYPSQSMSPYHAPQAQSNGYFPPTFPSAPSDLSQAPPALDGTIASDANALHDPSTTTFPDAQQPSQQYLTSKDDGLDDVTMNGQSTGAGNGSENPADPKESKKNRSRPEGPLFKPGIKACESCGSSESPEWRKGPSGAKSLCNACGLRYARSVARQKKLAEQAENGIPPKKKKSKKVPKEDPPAASAPPSAISSLPATSSAHTTFEPAFSRGDSLPGHKAYTPYYTAAPPRSSSYALVAAHPASSTPGALPPTSAVSAYPASSSGYYPATTSYPFSTYPPTSAPILTHIPIHHTLAATLAPMSAPVSIHSHEYPRNGPMPTSVPHSSSFSSSSNALHAFTQAHESAGMYHHQHHPTSSVGGDWQPSYTSTEIHRPPTCSAPPHQPLHSPSFSSAPPLSSIHSHSTSPHLHHPQPSSAYQAYSAWSPEQRRSQDSQLEGGGMKSSHNYESHRLSTTDSNDYTN